MIYEINEICCIGAGYVGGPTMAIIADKCPHIRVNVVDINSKRIKAWNSQDLSELPIYEPGLDEVIKRTRSRNLHFSCNIKAAIESADMIFISVNTPTKKKGLGAGQASDLKYVEACARQVALYASNHTIIVEKSTLPVRTAEVIQTILESEQISQKDNKKPKSFDVLSNPEFLAEGSAINDLEYPDRVLIGGENKEAIDSLSEIYTNWVPKNKIIRTNIWSSELAKLTANAFLAQRLSSINSISAICESTGAEVREVSRAIGSDERIGAKFLSSGPGFGGSCFKKDILNLVYLSEYFGLPEVASFWAGVVELNNWHQHRISRLVVKKLFGTVSGKKISILGFAFKANTNDTRESAAINICKDLLEEGAILNIHDPKVSPDQISLDLGQEEKARVKEIKNNSLDGSWNFFNNIYDSIVDTDALIIITEWEEYSKINWLKTSQLMRQPAWIFDTRSIIDTKKIKEININFWQVGNGTINSK
mgnify:CR=1 FL=1|tara:strand:+ start:1038 stop:2477 length:1440 start_codon:yes stop_codon:yes gene_type:complete